MKQHPHEKPDTKRHLKKYIKDLYTYCKHANVSSLEKLTEKAFPGPCLNMALRKSINIFTSNNANVKKCIQILLNLDIDMNYQDDQDDKFTNSTVIDLLCMKNDLNLIKLILEPTPHKINFNLYDSNKRNLFHYLLLHFYKNEKQEPFIIEIFNYFFNEYIIDINTAVQNDFLNLLIQPDVNGNIALTLALLNGWNELTQLILKVMKFEQVVNNDGNNFIHCAVEGNNIKCLKVILYYSNVNDLKKVNNDKRTPLQLAYKKGSVVMGKVIEHFECNWNRKEYKEDFLEVRNVNEMNRFKLMMLVINEEYEKCCCGIEMYKIMEYIKCDGGCNSSSSSSNSSSGGSNYNGGSVNGNVSLEWNLLLITYKCLCNRGKHCGNGSGNNNSSSNGGNIGNNSNKKNKNTNQTSYLSFFYNNINVSQYPHSFFPLHDEFKLFFQKHFSNKSLVLQYNSLDPSPLYTPPQDILIYNKIIYHLNTNDIREVIDTINTYFTTIFPLNNTTYFKWITYVNISFILIELLIHHNYTDLSSFIIQTLDKFLFTTNEAYNTETKYSIQDKPTYNHVTAYLNTVTIFTQFSKTWDETFCYINLLKAALDHEHYDKYINDYNKLIERSKYIKSLLLFDKLELLHECLVIKRNYMLNETNWVECVEKINNESKMIYYYNTLGICNIKMKRFVNAEMCFRKALGYYKKIINEGGDSDSDSGVKIDYVYVIKFNLGLCLFYRKQFDKARSVFVALTKSKVFGKNFFVWYRLGLCCLQMELNKQEEIRSKYYNDMVKYVHCYEKKQTQYNVKYINRNEIHNEDDNDNVHKSTVKKTINRSNEDIDDLYVQFEMECNNNNNEVHERTKKVNVNVNYDDNEINISEYHTRLYRKFIMHNCNYYHTCKLLSNNTNTKYKKTISYLNESIFALKQSILLANNNIFHKSTLQSIYDFYTKTNNNKSNNTSSYFKSSFSSSKENQAIIINAYINLLFALSLQENWLQILFYANEFKSHNYQTSNTVNINIQSYYIEALIHLGKYSQAEIEIQSLLELHQNENYNCNYYCKINKFKYCDVNFKMNLYYNLCLIHLKNGNVKQAEEYVEIMYDNYIVNKKSVPGFFTHLIVYINLIKYNNCIDKEDLVKEFNSKRNVYIKNVLSIFKRRRMNTLLCYHGQ